MDSPDKWFLTALMRAYTRSLKNKQHNNKFDYLSWKPFIFSWNLSSFMLRFHWPQTAFITRIFEEKYALNRILSPSQRVWSLVVQLHSWATAWYLTKEHSFFLWFFTLLFLMLVLFLSIVKFCETHISNTT